MAKEYFSEIVNPETGEKESRKLGPAYFEDSPEFQREIASATEAAERAARDVFADEFFNREARGVVPQAREAAEKIAAALKNELAPPERDSTLASAAVEAKLALLDHQEEEERARTEEAGEDVGERLTKLKDVQAERDEYERLHEILFSVNPHLAALYTRKDVVDWARLVTERIHREVKKFKEEHPEEPSNVRVGDVENRAASFKRFMEGGASREDYNTILAHLEVSKSIVRERLRDEFLKYGFSGDEKETRKSLLGLEKIIFQYDQMARLIDEERLRPAFRSKK